MQTQSGQEPTGQQSGAQSQVNGAGDPNTTVSSGAALSTGVAATPQSGAQSQVNGDEGGNETALTREQLLRELARTRTEAADTRTKLRAYETAQEEAARAQMTREERLASDLANAERQREELVIKHQERAMRYEAQLQAAKLNIIDPDAAVKLLDTSRLEYDDDGTPKNIGTLLQELVAAKPYLIAPTSGKPVMPSASPTNPSSADTRTVSYTDAQIAAMTPAEYKKHKAAIWQAQREGRIRN